MQDVLVIGGGPAGLTAAIYAKRAGLSVSLVERLFSGGQMATASWIENYPGFASGVSGADLAMEMERHVRSLEVPIVYGDIDSIEFGAPHAVISGGIRREARALILCMGAKPRTIGAPGEERLAGRGVSYCATCDGAFFTGKTVAVVGGGNSAAEDALHLARTGATVHLIHRRGELRAEAALAERVAATPNIILHWNREVSEIAGDQRVSSLSLKAAGGEVAQAETLAVDGVFIAAGREPQTAILSGRIALDEAGYILAAEDTRTSLPLVYAAGDIRRKPLRQIVTAAADGAVAAWAVQQDIT